MKRWLAQQHRDHPHHTWAAVLFVAALILVVLSFALTAH
jgi:hypothetical protein